MFSFFKKKAPPPAVPPVAPGLAVVPAAPPAAGAGAGAGIAAAAAEPRSNWLGRLAQGLRKTGAGITQVFTGTRIDDALYEDLESALLLADTGMAATQYLLADLKRRVKETRATDPAAVKACWPTPSRRCCCRCNGRWSSAASTAR